MPRWTCRAFAAAILRHHTFGSEGYAIEELVAELGAAFLCADLDLTLEPRKDHAAYIANWLNVPKADNRAIFTAASHAQRAAAFINGLLGTNLKTNVASDNIRMEARYLALLLHGTGNRVCEAVASYYQGYATLQHIGVLPESQVYVSSVLGLRPRFA